MAKVKIVGIITLIFTCAFTICLGTESSIKTLIGLAFFSLYFLIITVTTETDEKIDKIAKAFGYSGLKEFDKSRLTDVEPDTTKKVEQKDGTCKYCGKNDWTLDCGLWQCRNCGEYN